MNPLNNDQIHPRNLLIKYQCDNASPECSNCSRSRVACMYSDNAYPSSYVKRMEERVRQLEATISSGIQRPVLDTSTSSASTVEINSPQPRSAEPVVPRHAGLANGLGLLSSCAAAEPHYFGFSAGLSLAHFVQIAIDSGNNSVDVSLPLLADRPFSNHALTAKTALAQIPSFTTGASYIRAYLSLVHPLYPFLDRHSLWKFHGSLSRPADVVPASYSQMDIALIHLVYAIGSRCLQLLGKKKMSEDTPEGHFLSAMKAIGDDMKFTSLRSIEVTLLLAIHSMRSPSGMHITSSRLDAFEANFFNKGTSVWHLAGLAIRQCIELGLHKQRMVDCHNLQFSERRKRLFWSVYIFERKTALVLGRPFALSDEEICLDLPMNVDDNEHEERNLIAAAELNPSLQPLRRTTLSFHRFHVELYQIHTEIRLALHQLKKQTKVQVQHRMAALFEQLEDWRMQVLGTFEGQGIPRVPRSSHHIRTRELGSESDSSKSDQEVDSRPVEVEKEELLLEYYKARRSLLQPLMTEGRDNYPFDAADYTACADASGQICQLYRRLHRLSPIPFSLRDLHAIFVAGFTLIYCICTCPSIYSTQRASDIGACSTVLYVITEQWSSAKKYRDAFELVAEKMMESTRKYEENISRGASLHLQSEGSQNRTPQMRISPTKESNASSNNRDARRETVGISLSSENGTHSRHDPRSRSSHTTALFPEIENADFFQSESHIPAASSFGMELDLELGFYDIEGLLSGEGLDWFTGAVS